MANSDRESAAGLYLIIESLLHDFLSIVKNIVNDIGKIISSL